ncbi:uncharacterized protein LOC128089670 [Tympanuchus pallidicinctus]|uniref:uncharacterized protein LOC128089670 n=1 Tax=Tympanuchus pallidicinctus TaxID=109042 RepID=UPI002286D9E5|nr:uncharacterized protein LOC128089670 [Tympanuchus pallidicinctus]
MSPHGLGQHGRGSCTLRAILGCFLQISHALHAILHLPSTKGSAWQLIHKLYVGMLFQISFLLQCTQHGCFSAITDDEDMSPVNIIRHAVESMRALFQHLKSDGLVEDIEQQGGWDMLMSLDTYHTGVAVLTRALRSTVPLCCPMVFEETVTALAQRQEHKEIGTMAVFAEVGLEASGASWRCLCLSLCGRVGRVRLHVHRAGPLSPLGTALPQGLFPSRLRKRVEEHAFGAAPESERLHMAVRAGAAGRELLCCHETELWLALGLLPWALRGGGSSSHGSCRRGRPLMVLLGVFQLLKCVKVTDIVAYVNGYSIQSLLQSHLKSQYSLLRDLATTSLVRLSAIPEMAVTLQDLLPEITEQLQDAHSIIGVKSVTVLHNMLHLADREKVVPTALQLPELLLPFFFNESAQTRQRSILLCKDAMEVAGDTHTVEIKEEVHNILVPLFFHLHDEDQSVAQASWEALLCAAKLLKHRHLSYLLKTAQLQRIGECLLVGHSSRADQFLEQSLSYLCSPQEPLQEAAIRFIGLAGRHLRNGREEKLNTTIEVRGKHALSPRRAEPAEPGQKERGSRSGSRPQLHRTPVPARSSGDAAPSPPMAILKESAKDSKGNQHIHALTPTGPHDVQMWNTDRKKSRNHNS